jgi:glycosyltransferase involved in cell wall biosynthesis
LIVFLLPDFKSGGAQRVILNLIVGLQQKRIHVEIIVVNNQGPLVADIPEGVKIHNLQKSSMRRSIFKLVRKLRELNPNVVFSTFGYINIVLLMLRFFLPLKLRIWIREANLPSISLPNNPYKLLMKLGYRTIYQNADKIFSSSQRMTDEFINDFNLPISKLQLLPNPVNSELIQLNISKKNVFKTNTINFIAVGRLTYQKGFDRLLRWFSIVDKPNTVLRIIGTGPMETELMELSIELNIIDRVFFMGYLNNPWGEIAASDIFLLPSRWEGMPNAALESLACGTPVIATNESGGILEISELTNEGEVIVTSTDSEFCNEMKKVRPQKNHNNKKSLLPARFSIENACNILINHL